MRSSRSVVVEDVDLYDIIVYGGNGCSAAAAPGPATHPPSLLTPTPVVHVEPVPP